MLLFIAACNNNNINNSNKNENNNIIEVTDIDGNKYKTVVIGGQIWMAENLRTTHFANGVEIPLGENIYSKPFRFYPNNDAKNVKEYGYLYTWSAAVADSSSFFNNNGKVQGICPDGWHLPSDNEWKQMEMAVGMSQSDADNTGYRGNIAAKLCGNTGWSSSTTSNAAGNLNAPDRNPTGFSALPAGDYYSGYNGFGNVAYFWSATEGSSGLAYYRSLNFGNAGVSRNNDPKSFGYSVRCVRD